LYLLQIFRASPLMAIALCVCLATIVWCILLARRQQVGLDRLLTALLGIIAMYEAVRLFRDSGILLFPGIHKLDGWVDFIIASLYLGAVWILKASSSERASTKVRLRLVEANEKTVEPGKMSVASAPEASIVFDASPLATFAQDSSGMVIYWNSAAERLFGWNRDEILGQRLPFATAGPLRNKQGRQVEAAVWNAPFRGSSGTARGTLTIAADSPVLRAASLEVAHLSTSSRLSS
jgi:PAS domain-containing protein